MEQESYNIANSLSMESTSPLRLIGVFMRQTLEHIDVPCYVTCYHTHNYELFLQYNKKYILPI